jgi:serine/threonine protein kinase
VLEPGVIVAGDFRIEGVLGEGGMGVVYEARQLSLERTVALKLVGTAYSENIAFRERFRREGRIQANIEHRHVIDVYAAGESEYGLFLAMRLVRGASLGDLIGKPELTVDRTVRVLTQIGSALDAAHEVGLIHRDIKPHNILIDLRHDHSYLADFGVTKARGTTGLTQAGQHVGTYAYMAPEQFRGHEATELSDIYAFGAVLYESLVGTVPYPMPTLASIINAHLSEPVPAVTEHRPELPPLLDTIVRKAMAKEPEDRYETASEMMQEVSKAVESRAALAEPTTLSIGTETTISPGHGATSVPTKGETTLSEPPTTEPRRPAEPTTAATVGSERLPVTPPPEPTTLSPVTASTAPAPTPPPSHPDSAIDVATPPPVHDATEVAPRDPTEGLVVEAPRPAVTQVVTPGAGEGVRVPGGIAAEPRPPSRGPSPAAERDRARPERRGALPWIAAAAVAALAVIGFFLGRGSAPERHRTVTDATQRAATSGDISVSAPITWRKESTPPTIPGLKLGSALALVPTGNAGSGGFVAGTVPRSWPTFLPSSFRRAIGQAAVQRRSVVRLGDLSAFRYSGLKPRGFDGTLTVYAVPQARSETVVACYGTGGAAPPRQCDQIAASLQLGTAKDYPLAPSPQYAQTVRRAIQRLDTARSRGLRALGNASTQKQQAAAATGIAKAYGTLTSRLKAAEPTAYVRPAQLTIVAAARRVEPAYAALARAASKGDSGGYEAARAVIRSREAQLRAAVAKLKQLGFKL